MENKKLLKYLLKDLSELDEMFSEKGKNSFDEMEMEFIQNRISGSKKLVQLIIDHANDAPADIQVAAIAIEKPDNEKPSDLKEKTISPPEVEWPKNGWVEAEETVSTFENTSEVVVNSINSETKSPRDDNQVSVPVQEMVEEVEKNEPANHDIQIIAEIRRTALLQQELKMEEEEPVDNHHKRLGDSFLKEKSVNDIVGDDFSKLEHKLSNRPVSSIQAAIGINDRFQYIRELFEGSADSFAKTVADLDSMNDIKDAVNYLQNHFKWKKNETSLKFVSLIKRRFPNE